MSAGTVVLSLWRMVSGPPLISKDVKLDLLKDQSANFSSHAFSAFLENFNYIDSSGKKVLSWFRNAQLSSFLKDEAYKIIKIIKKIEMLETSCGITEEEKINKFLQHIEGCVTEVKDKRLEWGTLEMKKHNSIVGDYMVVNIEFYQTAYPPATFEKYLTAALRAMQPHFKNEPNERINKIIATIQEAHAPVLQSTRQETYSLIYGA